MVVLNRIYTRTGDAGETALGSGERVSKAHLRIQAYGTVDETNATLGVVRLHTGTSDMLKLDQMLARIQNELFDLGADLCVPETGKDLEIIVPRTTTSQSGESSDLICKQMTKAGIKCTVGTPLTSTNYILAGFGLKQQMSIFSVSNGYYAEFATLFTTKTDLEMSGFRFTDPTLAECFTKARDVATRAAFAPCVKTLSSKSFWVPLYLEGGFLAWNKTAQGVGATTLPGGGARPLINGSGFDFASVTKTKG